MNQFKTLSEPAAVICPESLPISRAHTCDFTLSIGLVVDGNDNNNEGSSRYPVSGVGAPFGVRGAARTGVGLLQIINSVHRFISSSGARFDLPPLAAFFHRWIFHLLLLCCATLFLAACANHSNDLVPDQNKVGVTVSAVGHYGSMIGIPQYSIDGFYGGNNSGWGGGGSTSCCVLLPRTVTKPIFVTVKWRTCDISHIKFVNDRIVDPTEQCIRQEHEATVPIHFAAPAGEGAGLKVHFLPGHYIELWYTRQGPTSHDYPGPPYPFGPAPPYAALPEENQKLNEH